MFGFDPKQVQILEKSKRNDELEKIRRNAKRNAERAFDITGMLADGTEVLDSFLYLGSRVASMFMNPRLVIVVYTETQLINVLTCWADLQTLKKDVSIVYSI
eukprot:jgi/Bigna1/141666/aug1.64_g16374